MNHSFKLHCSLASSQILSVVLLETTLFFPSIPNKQFRAKSTTDPDLPLMGDAEYMAGKRVGALLEARFSFIPMLES